MVNPYESVPEFCTLEEDIQENAALLDKVPGYTEIAEEISLARTLLQTDEERAFMNQYTSQLFQVLKIWDAMLKAYYAWEICAYSKPRKIFADLLHARRKRDLWIMIQSLGLSPDSFAEVHSLTQIVERSEILKTSREKIQCLIESRSH